MKHSRVTLTRLGQSTATEDLERSWLQSQVQTPTNTPGRRPWQFPELSPLCTSWEEQFVWILNLNWVCPRPNSNPHTQQEAQIAACSSCTFLILSFLSPCYFSLVCLCYVSCWLLFQFHVISRIYVAFDFHVVLLSFRFNFMSFYNICRFRVYCRFQKWMSFLYFMSVV